MHPLVSILIPAYNAESWLAETLISALSQTWPHKEIIVVDDGSHDRTLAIAQSFQSHGVKVFHQSNRGASAARNRALQESHGDWIQYLDADDLLAVDKIERQLQALKGQTQGVVTAEWARFYHYPIEASFTPQPLWQDMPPINWLVCAWEGNWMMHPAAWLIPRGIMLEAGLWNEQLSLNDDGEYFCRIVLASQTVQFCPGARSFYRSGLVDSLSGSQSETAWTSMLRSLVLDSQRLLQVENSDRVRHACATRFQRFIYEVYPDYPELCYQADAWLQRLGGSDLLPIGGPKFQRLAAMLGWRQAKKLKQFNDRWRNRPSLKQPSVPSYGDEIPVL